MDTIVFRPGRGVLGRLIGRNPLVRSTDRLEALALLLAVALVLVAVPVAGAVGTAVHSSRAAVYAAQVHSRHPVAAAVVRDSDASVRPYSVTFSVHARWSDRGVTHEADVPWDRSVKAGEQLSIWVDNASGDYAGPPPRPDRAAADAISAAVVLWLSVVTLAASAIGLVRFRLDRRRHAQWDQGLRTLADSENS
ncbi:Rv1733c family protein [Mycolicibacterium sp. CBM1]